MTAEPLSRMKNPGPRSFCRVHADLCAEAAIYKYVRICQQSDVRGCGRVCYMYTFCAQESSAEKNQRRVYWDHEHELALLQCNIWS